MFGSVPEAVLGVRVPSSDDRFLVPGAAVLVRVPEAVQVPPSCSSSALYLFHAQPFSCAYRRHSRCPPSAAPAHCPREDRIKAIPPEPPLARVPQQLQVSSASRKTAHDGFVYLPRQPGVLHSAQARPRRECEARARELVEFREEAPRTSGGRDPKRGPSRSSPSPRGSRPSSFGRGASRMSPRMVSSTEGMRIRRAKESEGLTTCGGGFSELPSWCV